MAKHHDGIVIMDSSLELGCSVYFSYNPTNILSLTINPREELCCWIIGMNYCHLFLPILNTNKKSLPLSCFSCCPHSNFLGGRGLVKLLADKHEVSTEILLSNNGVGGEFFASALEKNLAFEE